MSALKYRADIDGLRAVAVVAVILDHLAVPGFSGGFVGVDVFFAISGYLIASIILRDLEDRHFSIARFYERRIRRILPALFAVMAVTTPIAFWLLLPGELRAFSQSLAGTALFSSNFIFWHQAGYFAAQSSTKPLLHTWSLGIEEQFYILFPILLILLVRTGRKSAAWILAGLAALSYAACIWETFRSSETAFFFPQYRAWELLAGSTLALAGHKPMPIWLSNAACGIGLALIVVAVAAFTPATHFPGPYAIVPVLGALLVIQSGDRSDWLAGPALRASPVTFLGRISYSLYLWHWPLIAFSSYYLLHPPTAAQAVIILCLSLVLATLSWRWIEQPVRQSAWPRLGIFAVAIAGTAIFASVGAVGHLKAGFPGRFPAFDKKSYYNKLYLEGPCQVAAFSDWDEAACTFPSHPPANMPRVLVWGDSFASQYVEGLRQLKTQIPFATIQGTKAGCAPLLEGGAARNPGCAAFNQARLDRTITERPDAVIVAGDWRQTTDPAHVESGLRTTLMRLKQAGIPTLVIGDAPIYYSDVPQIERMLRRRGDQSQWYVPWSSLWADPFIRVLAKENGAHFFSPREYFCAGVKCRFTDGELFSLDEAHLSAHGSVMVVRAMRPQIEALLKDARSREHR